MWGTDFYGADTCRGVALPHSQEQAPDTLHQASRRAAFQDAHPLVHLAAVGDKAQATVPTPDGTHTLTRTTWRTLLDELGAPAVDSGPG